MEAFYLKAYEVPAKDVARHSGRAFNYKFKTSQVRERGLRRPRYQSFEAGWWSRVANTLELYCTLVGRGKGEQQQRELLNIANRLSQEEVPSAGARPSANARFHRTLWQQRLADLSKVETQTLLGMALQASDETSRAHRHDLEKELREWADWLADPVKASPGKLHKITKPLPVLKTSLC